MRPFQHGLRWREWPLLTVDGGFEQVQFFTPCDFGLLGPLCSRFFSPHDILPLTVFCSTSPGGPKAAGVSHESLRAQTCTFEVPEFKKHHKIPREDSQRERERKKKNEKNGREREKMREMLAEGVVRRKVVQRNVVFEGGPRRGWSKEGRSKPTITTTTNTNTNNDNNTNKHENGLAKNGLAQIPRSRSQLLAHMRDWSQLVEVSQEDDSGRNWQAKSGVKALEVYKAACIMSDD